MSIATMKKQTAATYRTSLTGSRGNQSRDEYPGIFSTVGKYRKTTSYTGSWSESAGIEPHLLRPIQSYDQYYHQRTTHSRRPFPYSTFRPASLTYTRQSDYIQERSRRTEICSTPGPDRNVEIPNASFSDPAQLENTASSAISSSILGWSTGTRFNIGNGTLSGWGFTNPPLPYTQYAILRSRRYDNVSNNFASEIKTSIELEKGTYVLSFWARGSHSDGPNPLWISIGGLNIYTFTPSSLEWQSYSVEFGISEAGEKEFKIYGLVPLTIGFVTSAITGMTLLKHTFCSFAPLRYHSNLCGTTPLVEIP